MLEESRSVGPARPTISLFGRPRFTVAGAERSLPERERALALLAYLALHPGAQSRERVAFALLPDESEEAARASLRRQLLFLSKIEPLARENWLKAGFRTVAWEPDSSVDCDVRMFERTSGEGAVALYTGDLLPGVFDEWIEPHRKRLRERQITLLLEVATQRCEEGAFPEAILLVRRALEYDPWREDALRLLLLARARNGDRSGAVEEYRAFAQRIHAELGVEPMLATIQTNEAIAGGSFDAGPPGNLPGAIPAPLGRETELQTIGRLFEESRVITLTGMGGIGKTTLALAAASAQRTCVPGGTFFVDLSGLRDAGLVERTTAAAFGVQEAPGTTTRDALVQHIADQAILLVLDNAEHVLEQTASMVRLLNAACPRLSILTTSREALDVRGEHVYIVPPLAIPAHAAGIPAREAGTYGAVALFCARARASDPNFSLTDDNAGIVIELCRKLDGIPLALELAAARTSVLTPGQLLERIDRRLRLLAGNSRAVSLRQRTMRRTIEWSYDLLSAEERATFRRMGLFDTAFPIEAASAVGGAGDLDEWDILDAVSSLTRKSLLVVEDSPGRKCFRMLESIKEFARERLQEAGDFDSAVESFIGYYLSLSRRMRAVREESTARDEINSQLMPEFENIRAAVMWALGERRDVAAGAEIVASTAKVLRRRSKRECREWCEMAVTVIDELDPVLAAKILGTRASVAATGSDRVTLSDDAIAAARRINDPRILADALSGSAFANLKSGNIERAAAEAAEALEVRRMHGTAVEVADALDHLAAAEMNRGRLELARSYLEEAERLDGNAVSMRLIFLAETAFALGDVVSARDYGRAAIPPIRAVGDRLNLPLALCNLAAYEYRAEGTEAARQSVHEALLLSRDEGFDANVALAIQYAASLALARGAPETAARLLGYAEARFRENSLGRETTEQWMFDDLMERLKGRLGIEELDRLLKAGARTNAAQAFDSALTTVAPERGARTDAL